MLESVVNECSYRCGGERVRCPVSKVTAAFVDVVALDCIACENDEENGMVNGVHGVLDF